jgi:hypothetical protein
MSKPKIAVQEAAANIAGSVLAFSAQTTQQIGELLVPRPSLLKKTFSSQHRNAERLEVLKLNCDIVLPHVAVAEYNIEHGDYWDRDNSDIAASIRQLSFQAIVQAFEKAGCAVIDANLLVRDRAERFAIYAATALLGNISEEIMKDHQLPSNMSARPNLFDSWVHLVFQLTRSFGLKIKNGVYNCNNLPSVTYLAKCIDTGEARASLTRLERIAVQLDFRRQLSWIESSHHESLL